MGKLEAKLDGKIALITGGSSGNRGLATAKRFCRGRRPMSASRDVRETEIGGRRQGHRQKKKKKNVKALKGDVSNLDDLDRILAVIKQDKGRLDIVFANAGHRENMPVARRRSPKSSTTPIFDINVKGMLFHGCRRRCR